MRMPNAGRNIQQTERHISHILLKSPFSLILQLWQILLYLDTLSLFLSQLLLDLATPDNVTNNLLILKNQS